MEKQEEGWQELVLQAREQIKADLRGRDLPPPEKILAQVREERDEHLAAGFSACLLAGGTQFLLLRMRMAVSGWWIWTYLVGYGLFGFWLLQYVLGSLVIDVIPNDFWKRLPPMAEYHVGYFLVGLSTGFGVGLLQWILLRKHLDKAAQWFGIALLSGSISGLARVLEIDAWGLASQIATQGVLSGLFLHRWLCHVSEGASGQVY